jgi:ABC-type multidrug transport system fused ATPase/permease subunit
MTCWALRLVAFLCGLAVALPSFAAFYRAFVIVVLLILLYLTVAVLRVYLDQTLQLRWRLSIAFHSRQKVGDIMFRVTADSFAVQTMLMNGLLLISAIVLLTAAPVTDAAIRGKLAAELEKQSWAPRGSFNAVVENGVVDLQGIILDERQRAALRIAAENIPGIIQVHDHLLELDRGAVE